MPRQLLLEGPNLEALIVRARTEYGADCRIVKAEKVRSGGFLGFFARERFELTVEVSEAAAGGANPGGSRQVSGQLAGQITAAMSVQDAALAQEIADAQAAREAMLAETLATPTEAVTRPVESTDMAEFDRLVMSLAEEAAREIASVDFVPAVFPAAHAVQEATETVSGYRDNATTSREAPRPQGRLGHPSSYGTFGRGIGDASAGEDEAARQADGPTGEGTPEPLDLGATQADGVVLHRWGVFTDVATAVSTSCTVPALLALGVPRRYVERFESLDTPVPLLEVVAQFGVPPVRRPEPGDLVVIAGPAEQAVVVATQVAAWMGMPATSVVLAGQIDAIRGHGRRIRTEAEAAAARRRADKAAAVGEPLIVALGIAPGKRGAAAAAPMLAAFDADTAWAVVDATKRAAVQEPALALLSSRGRIDALAAIGTAEAQAPGALLNASLPVAWLDGLPAASVVWAALIGERIAERD